MSATLAAPEGADPLTSILALAKAGFDAFPIGVYACDDTGRIVRANRRACELWGRHPCLNSDQERFCGASRLFTLDGESLPPGAAPMAKALADGLGMAGVEAVVENLDGHRWITSMNIEVLRDEDGAVVGAVNCFQDVTELHRRRKQTADSAFLRALVEATPECSNVVTPDGGLVDSDAAVRGLRGPETARGLNALDLIASLHRFTDRLYRAPDAECAYEAALDAITEALGCERASLLLADPDGVMRFVAWRGLSQRYRVAVEGHTPWRADVQDPESIWVRDIEATDEPEPLKAAIREEGIRALGFIPLVSGRRLVGKFMVYSPDPRDFTPEQSELALTVARQLGLSIERRRIDERLREQAEEFHALADNIPALCWMAYADGEVYWFNRRWYDYTGTSPETQLGTGWTGMLDPKALPEVLDRWNHSLATGEPFDMTFPLRAADGEFRPHLTRVVPIRNADGRIRRWFGTNTDVALQARQQEHLKLLINELNHRVKNTLATVQSMASRSLRHAATASEALDAFEGRLLALSRAHNLLTESRWEGADLEDLVSRALAPFTAAGSERVLFHGPAVWLTQRRAISLAMMLHELATNAMKYGALSSEAGRLEVGWSVIRPSDGLACVRFDWREHGGPLVGPPSRQGLGMRLIERTIRSELGGVLDLRYEPEGLVCRAELPIDPPGTTADLAPPHAPTEIVANWPTA